MKPLGFLLCSCLISYADAEPTNLLYLIQALNVKINAATNLFYTTTNASLEFQEVLQQQLPPKILTTAKTATRLEDLYNSNVLTVVFLAHTFTEQLQQLHDLLHTNRRLTQSLVLFVAYGYEEQRWLFEWCWQQRLLHVLLLTVDNTTNFTTYTPFPHLQLVNTTLSVYFDEYYAQANFKGYPIHFDGGISLPHSLVFEDKQGKLVLNGFVPRLIELFAAIHNATLLQIRTSEEFNLRNCTQMIEQKILDLCTELYFVGGKLYLTKPLFLSNVHLLVPCADPLPKFHYFTAPFSLQLWLFIAFTLIVLTVILALMCWCGYSKWCTSELFCDLFACVLYFPFYLRPFSGYTHRILLIVLVIFGYMISTYYLALLTSFFSIHIYEKEINDISDLKQRNLTIIISNHDFDYLNRYNASPELIERIRTVPSDVLISKELALDTRYGYLCADHKCSLLLSQQNYMQHCKVRIIIPPTSSVWAGIAIGNNTVFEQSLNFYLQRVFETGIYEYLQLQSQKDAMRMNITNNLRNEHERTVKPLPLDVFRIPAMVLVTGYVLSIMTFLGELVQYHYWK